MLYSKESDIIDNKKEREQNRRHITTTLKIEFSVLLQGSNVSCSYDSTNFP